MGTIMVVVIFPIMVFSILYLIDKNMRNSGDGFSEPIFRYITVPQGKVARIIAGIFIAIQILGTIAYTSHVFSNDFEGTIITALINICLAIVYIYINIKFLYGYRTFWLYLILFSSFLITFNEANSSGLIWLAMAVVSLDIFFRLVMVFHYFWHRDNDFGRKVERIEFDFLTREVDYNTLEASLLPLGFSTSLANTLFIWLTNEKLLINAILLKASEIAKTNYNTTEDYLLISQIAATIAKAIDEYLNGCVTTEGIPEELLILISKIKRGRFKYVYAIIRAICIVEYGNENFGTMDDIEKKVFYNSLSLIGGSKTLKNFLRQQ